MAYCSVRGTEKQPVSSLRDSPYRYLTRSRLKREVFINGKKHIITGVKNDDINSYMIAIKQRLKITNLNDYTLTYLSKSRYQVIFHHQLNHINCPEILARDQSDHCIDHCSIYKKMMDYKLNESNDYAFTRDNLEHMQKYTHYADDDDKPLCKYSRDCNAFKRMEQNGNRLDDKCHMAIFKHSVRMSEVKSPDNIKEFIVGDPNDRTSYNGCIVSQYEYENMNDEHILKQLVEEVVTNGFEQDLWVKGSKRFKVKNITDYTLFRFVDEKMNCFRHTSVGSPLEMHEMLSIILYTGCESNWDLCETQRNDDYRKWKWFDICLQNAISKLCACEAGKCKVWSGLKNVNIRITNKNSSTPFMIALKSYTSASAIKSEAIDYIGNKQLDPGQSGLLLEISPYLRQSAPCCDVSWISRFPDEAEILFQKRIQVE
eukprot:49273_1